MMEKVIVISFYDNEELDLSVEKEIQLRKYCKSNKYEIEDMCREPQYYNLQNSVYTIFHYLEQCIKGKNTFEKINKIILYSIYDIANCEEDIIMYASMFSAYNVRLETIKEGVLGEDLKYCSGIYKNNNILERNKQFIICEDSPFD